MKQNAKAKVEASCGINKILKKFVAGNLML